MDARAERVRIGRLALAQLASLDDVIAHVETTSEDSWRVGTVGSADGVANCFFGHLFSMGATDSEGGACRPATSFNWPRAVPRGSRRRGSRIGDVAPGMSDQPRAEGRRPARAPGTQTGRPWALVPRSAGHHPTAGVRGRDSVLHRVDLHAGERPGSSAG